MTNTEIPTDSKSKLRQIRYHVAIFLAAAGILVVGGIWHGGEEKGQLKSESAFIEELRKEVSGLQVGLNRSELEAIQDSITKAVAPVTGSIVGIRPVEGVEPLRAIPLYSDVQTQNDARPAPAILSPGMSGIVIDAEGYVLTSANVAALGERVQLIFADGSEQEGEIVGLAEEDYLALVKMPSPPANLAAASFARMPAELRPGEWLIRHGRSPSGRESLSLCLLESVRHTADGHAVGLLDSGAAPEIDGGALIDMSGRIAGLYAAPPEAPGFVVPIARALNIAARLKTTPKTVPQSWIGVELQDLTEDLREYFGVQSGALVAQVVPGSPAALAGLRPRDAVQTFDGAEVVSATALTAAITEKPAGTPVQLGIQRGLQNRVITVVTEPHSIDGSGSFDGDGTLMLKIQDTVSANGPEIVSAGPPGLANRLGLASGDIIKSVNGRPVRRSAELVRSIRAPAGGKPLLFEIQRADRIFFVAIKERVEIDE